MKFSDYTMRIEEVLQDITYPGGELSGLYEPISYALDAGGKRLRPALLLMTAEAFGGDPALAESAAAGVEMFHNFTLLHDDVMDNSDLRRNRQTVHAKWDTNTAILSGDTMLTLATRKVAEVPDGVLRPVLDTFNSMALRVYEGQRLDMDFETREEVSIEEYIRMISDKTGALIGGAAKIGALVGGATSARAECMERFGEALGIAFQIQDDWLDVFGDSTTFGKPIGGDINNNKKSYLLLTGLCAGTPESDALREAMRLPAGDTKVRVVTNLYERMDLSARCREAIALYSKQALKALKESGLDEERREPFRQLTDKLTGRRK